MMYGNQESISVPDFEYYIHTKHALLHSLRCMLLGYTGNDFPMSALCYNSSHKEPLLTFKSVVELQHIWHFTR